MRGFIRTALVAITILCMSSIVTYADNLTGLNNIANVQDLNEFIRNNETMNNLRNLNIPSECLTCNDRYRCNGGSKCVTYAQTGKLGIRDINCFKRFSKGEQLK